MIELNNVTKYYPTKQGKHYVLKDVSAVFPDKKSVGILGRNGTGKSTLMRLIGGIEFPNHGTIKSTNTISWPMALSGGYQGSLSGRDNARLVCKVYGKTRNQTEKALDFILEFSELGKYFDEPVKSYSSGMRSRLGFATSMAFKFDYYLMDEVTSVGDPGFREKAAQALENRISEANVIFVSHNTAEIARLCDIGVFIVDNKLVVYEDVQEAIERYNEYHRER